MADKLFGLLGRKLGHSWSVPVHKAFGREQYRLIELEPEELGAFLARTDLGGLNVTIPYKKTVLPYCGELSADAAAIGSVNTLVRRPDGVLWGGNTDAAGFRYMAARAGVAFRGKKVVVLGTGGASVTVQAEVRTAGAREVVVVSRTGAENYGNLPRHADAEILVNATPVGMYPNCGASPVELDAFPRLEGVLDLVYNPLSTALLLQARARGIPCSDGLPMLVEQAAESEAAFAQCGEAVKESDLSADNRRRVLNALRRDRTNIVLIGMPGSGKSTIGRRLGERTGRAVVDIDAAVTRRAGKPIPDIFAADGEAAFRALEREETARAGQEAGQVIVTGGGVVKDAANYAALKQNGRIYHLIRDLNALPVKGRPLSQETGVETLWAEREPLYRQFRDAAVENNGTVERAVEWILDDFTGAEW